MIIDFSSVPREGGHFYGFAQGFTVAQIHDATRASVTRMRDLIAPLTDAHVTFIPHDPDANDPHAPEAEQFQGWSVAHLVAHMTATGEELAAVASVLARGIDYPRATRLRYETDWHTLTTHAQVMQRLDESLRIRLALLDSFPDQPHLDTHYGVPDGWIERFGKVNALAAALTGLRHEDEHWGQLQEAVRQALAAQA